jgi:hypothetical protein
MLKHCLGCKEKIPCFNGFTEFDVINDVAASDKNVQLIFIDSESSSMLV